MGGNYLCGTPILKSQNCVTTNIFIQRGNTSGKNQTGELLQFGLQWPHEYDEKIR